MNILPRGTYPRSNNNPAGRDCVHYLSCFALYDPQEGTYRSPVPYGSPSQGLKTASDSPLTLCGIQNAICHEAHAPVNCKECLRLWNSEAGAFIRQLPQRTEDEDTVRSLPGVMEAVEVLLQTYPEKIEFLEWEPRPSFREKIWLQDMDLDAWNVVFLYKDFKVNKKVCPPNFSEATIGGALCYSKKAVLNPNALIYTKPQKGAPPYLFLRDFSDISGTDRVPLSYISKFYNIDSVLLCNLAVKSEPDFMQPIRERLEPYYFLHKKLSKYYDQDPFRCIL